MASRLSAENGGRSSSVLLPAQRPLRLRRKFLSLYFPYKGPHLTISHKCLKISFLFVIISTRRISPNLHPTKPYFAHLWPAFFSLFLPVYRSLLHLIDLIVCPMHDMAVMSFFDPHISRLSFLTIFFSKYHMLAGRANLKPTRYYVSLSLQSRSEGSYFSCF